MTPVRKLHAPAARLTLWAAALIALLCSGAFLILLGLIGLLT